MINELPFKALLRVSLYFSLIMCFFLMISTFMEAVNIYNALYRSANSFLIIFLMSFTNIGLFYLLKDAPKDKKHKTQLYVSSFIISAIIINLSYLLNSYLLGKGFDWASTPSKVKGNIFYVYVSLQGFILNAFILLLQHFIIVYDANTKVQLENFRLNTARSEAAYQLLLQQIHPHFLFNALNILKSLIKKSPERAENYLLRLSDFLRVSVSQHKKGVATLTEEIKLCSDYLEMQKVRFGNALNFTFEMDTQNYSDGVLPLFSLQSLLENAIKHNELTEVKPLTINIQQHKDWIFVSNNIQQLSSAIYSTGSGLGNLSERYKLLSGDTLEIKNDGTVFSVGLKILKNEYSNH